MILLGIGILGVVLTAVFFSKMFALGNKEKKAWLYLALGAVCFVIGFVAAMMGYVEPFGGYEEPQLISTNEVTFTSFEGQDIYVINDGENIVCYEKVEVITTNGKEYKMKPRILSESTVEVIPEKYCQTPRIEEYIIEGKSSFPWSIAKENDKTEYKIYVPEGTILETVE
jgi:hypothetical protein